MAGTVEQARNRFLKQVVVSSAVGCAPPDTKNPVLRVILQSNKIMLTNCLNGARDVFRRGDPRRLGRGLRGQFYLHLFSRFRFQRLHIFNAQIYA